MKKWIFAAIVAFAIGAFWFTGNKSCDSRLCVINGSGGPVTDFEVYAGDKRLENASPTLNTLPTLEAGGQKTFAFSGIGQGAYVIRFTDAKGIRMEDSQGRLDPESAYDDTLMLLPAEGTTGLRLKQASSACKEPIHVNHFFRRLIRDAFRNLIRSL